jgi:hypothetical protein
MPIEIRELIIRATVADVGPRAEPGGDAEPGPREAGAAMPDHDALVQECVRQVLDILARDRER